MRPYPFFRRELPQGNGAGQAGTSEKSDGLKGAAYGKQTSPRHRRHDLPPPQAGHPALNGEENRQDHLPGVGAFQRNQHRNDGGQNQADAPRGSPPDDG